MIQNIRHVVIVTFIFLILINFHSKNVQLASQAVTSQEDSESYLIQWNTTYILRDIYSPRSLLQLKDGNYLVIGNRYPTLGEDCCPIPQSDLFLMKTTPDGTFMWLELYGNENIAMDLGYYVIETDDGLVISGRTNGPPAIGMDFMIIKTDLDGQIKWKRTYNKTSENEIRSFIQTADNGFALLGVSLPNDGNLISTDQTMWLLKTDSEGVIQWNRTYSSNFVEYTSMVQTDDGGYVLTSYDGRLLKTDSNGEIQWEKEIGGKLFSMIGEASSDLVLYGSKMDQPWLVKTDQDGDVLWNKTYSFNIVGDYIFSPNRSNLLNMVQASDGGFILTGSSIQVPDNATITSSDIWIIKTNTTGDIEWSHQFEVDTLVSFRAVMQDNEGDIVLVGEKKKYIWLVKIDLPPFAAIELSTTNEIDPTVSINMNESSITENTQIDKNTSFPSVFLVIFVVSTAVIIRRRKTKI